MFGRRSRPHLKSAAELTTMREAGRMVAEVLQRVTAAVAPGVTTGDLDALAAATMRELGAERASFLGYRVGGHVFPASICVSIDEEIVHGIPGRVIHKGRTVPDRTLQAGSVVSIDCGVVHGGYHGDSAVTVPVGAISGELEQLLDACSSALRAGIAAARPGGRLSDVAAAIEGTVREKEGQHGRRYAIVEEYVGHGVGRHLHEEPQVPNFVSSSLRRSDLVLEPGLVIAIEPMLCLGSRRTRTLRDGWTVVTRDGKGSCHFEHTVAVTADGPQVLTARADGGTTH